MSDEERSNVVRLLDLLAVEVAAGRRDTSLLRDEMHAGFRELRIEFGGLRSQFDGVEGRLGNLETRVEGFEDELRAFRGDVVQRLTRLDRSGFSGA
jgi:hypothetical protein